MFRWPQKYLTEGDCDDGAAIVTSVVPNDGFPVGAFVATATVVIVVRAAKTSAVAPRSVYLFSLKNEMWRILLVL